jgi:hypothetical protein
LASESIVVHVRNFQGNATILPRLFQPRRNSQEIKT